MQTSLAESTAENVRDMVPQPRRVRPDDLADLRQAVMQAKKAQRRLEAVRARIADDYDIDESEIVHLATGEIAPMPQQDGARG